MKTLIDLIESFKTRKKVALKYSNGYRTFVFSYKDFYGNILRYAQLLRQRGVAKGDKVVLWAPNSPEWVMAYFGIILTGGVVVPIDFRSSREHAEKIIGSAAPKIKVISKFKKRLIAADLVLEEMRFESEDLAGLDEKVVVEENDLVELVYTSGTTGDPKGVMISHKNLMSNLEAVVRRIDVSHQDTFLSVLPLSHLFEQTGNMLAPLYVGGTIIYLSTLKPSAIFSTLKKENVTIFILVPRLLQGIKKRIRSKLTRLNLLFRISKRLPFASRRRVWFFIHNRFGRSFRFFVSGGAALDPDTEKFWSGLGFKIIQGYGLTECSPILSANTDGNPLQGSVGKALDNVELKLSQEKEVLAKGPNIFQGYYEDKEKTEACFVDGWFRTGDVGEYDKEGNLYIRSRLKDTIITSAGVNVFPEDIEAVLNELEGVKESAVINKKTVQGEEVHAVLILEKPELDAGKIIDIANSRLEESQWIKSYSLWETGEFPKTSTLKIKKNLIREAVQEEKIEKNHVKESDPVARILTEVLSIETTEISDDKKLYFNLMLDSIGRVELVTVIEREFNIDFDEENINLQTTVGDLRRMIKKQTSVSGDFAEINWNYSGLMKTVRQVFLALLGNPLISIWSKVETEGLENLKNLKGPVIFAPNHTSYFDQAAIMIALPSQIRRQVATAAWDEYFRPDKKQLFVYLAKRLLFYICAIGWGAFGFSQSVNHKKSMEYIGKLVDRGNHILLFPEGERTQDGQMLPLKRGIDVLVNNLDIPVVPVGVIGLFESFPRGQAFPKKGKVLVRFGQPIYPRDFQDKNVMLFLGGKIRELVRRGA